MKLLLTSPTRELWQRVVGAMENVETDVAFLNRNSVKNILLCKLHMLYLNPLEALVNVPLPKVEAPQYGPVLVAEEGGQLQHPLAPLGNLHADPGDNNGQ